MREREINSNIGDKCQCHFELVVESAFVSASAVLLPSMSTGRGVCIGKLVNA